MFNYSTNDRQLSVVNPNQWQKKKKWKKIWMRCVNVFKKIIFQLWNNRSILQQKLYAIAINLALLRLCDKNNKKFDEDWFAIAPPPKIMTIKQKSIEKNFREKIVLKLKMEKKFCWMCTYYCCYCCYCCCCCCCDLNKIDVMEKWVLSLIRMDKKISCWLHLWPIKIIFCLFLTRRYQTFW